MLPGDVIDHACYPLMVVTVPEFTEDSPDIYPGVIIRYDRAPMAMPIPPSGLVWLEALTVIEAA